MSLDIKKHTDYVWSIKDLTHDLNISEKKWDLIFNHFVENSEVAYFGGARTNFMDDDFLKTVEYVSEEVLFDDVDEHFKILFRIKPANLILDRNLLSKVWAYYEQPAIYFFDDRRIEASFSECYKKNYFVVKCLGNIKQYQMLYCMAEQDVLWISSNQDINLPINSMLS
jgi:hypothetical protein